MKVYKPSPSTRSPDPKVVVVFTDFAGRTRSLRVGHDLHAAEGFAARLRLLMDRRSAGMPCPFDDGEAAWLRNMHHSLKGKLRRWGVVDCTIEIPAMETMLTAWELRVLRRNKNKVRARWKVDHVRRCFKAAGVERWDQIKPSALEAHIMTLCESGQLARSSINAIVDGIQYFISWCRDEWPHLPRISLGDSLKRVDATKGKPLPRRRALTVQEVTRLLDATGRVNSKRWAVYALAVFTGIRSASIRKIQVKHIDFTANEIYIVRDKAGHSYKVPIPDFLCKTLWLLLDGLKPHDYAFKLYKQPARMLKRDLAAAGIEASSDMGEKVDFHSLRATFGTVLSQLGYPPKLIQTAMRHADFSTTFNIYVKPEDTQAIRKAVDHVARLVAPDLAQHLPPHPGESEERD